MIVCVPSPPTAAPTQPPTPNTCGDPGTPTNGVKIGSDYSIGAVVKYRCRVSYLLVGSSSRVCQIDGSWSDSLPSCVRQGGKHYVASLFKDL